MSTIYSIDETRIVFEIFEAEVVLVNLDTGHYFVLEQSAGDIWRCLASGLTVAESAGILARRYVGNPGNLQQAIETFLHELVAEDLIQPTESVTVVGGLSIPEDIEPKLTFDSPALFKYTEMENLIQMDPIREVDESGWPKRRTFPKKKK